MEFPCLYAVLEARDNLTSISICVCCVIEKEIINCRLEVQCRDKLLKNQLNILQYTLNLSKIYF